MAFREVSRSHPCPVCAHTGWCRVTEDGELILCRRRDTHPTLGAGQKLLDRNQDPYFRYSTRDRTPKDPPRYSHTLGADHPADPEERHQVYAALLRALPASPEVDREFDRRKVAADHGVRKKCKWFPGPGRAGIARTLVRAGLESLMARTPGFYVKEGPDRDGKPQRWWSIAGAEGLVIPAYNADGYIVGLLIRPKEPTGPKYVWLTSGKRGGAKQSPPPIHVPHKFTGDTSTVRITEGALKAWVTTAVGDLLTIGLPGVYGGSRLIKTLSQLGAKTVRVAFDADMLRNRHVALATSRLYQLLTRRTKNRPLGFAVELERWAEADGKGIDDLLLAGKQPDVLQGDAVGRFIAEVVSGAGGSEGPPPPPNDAPPDPGPGPGRSGRVDLALSNNEDAVVSAAIAVLAAADRDLYQKDGELVEVVRRPQLGDKLVPPHIVVLDPPNLRTRATRFINFQAVTEQATKDVSPPKWLAPAVKSRNVWPGVRPITAVSTSPVLRADGSVHQTPGYDPVTGVLYTGDGAFDPIPEHPTHDDARAAMALLYDGVCQFPWREPVDFAVWAAEVLTIAARHAIPGPVPLFGHTANAPGSGKGELAIAAAVIATGRDLPTTPYLCKTNGKEDSTELRKTATALAIQGHVVYSLDNVPSGHGFGSGVLDAILTSTNNAGRELGTNKVPERAALTVWIITGNNIAPVGDTVRRTLMAYLLSNEERPHERTYTGLNVVAWARTFRPKLFTACLTILSAFIRAGRPAPPVGRMGSFDEWSNLVRSAVVWVGLPDPVLTQQRYQDENLDLRTTRDLIHLVATGIEVASEKLGKPCESITCSDIAFWIRKEMAAPPEVSFGSLPLETQDEPSLLEAYRRIFPDDQEPNQNRLGYLMRKFNGRTAGNKRLVHVGLDRNKVALWAVQAVPRAGDAGDVRGIRNGHPPHFNALFPNPLQKSAGDAGDVLNSHARQEGGPAPGSSDQGHVHAEENRANHPPHPPQDSAKASPATTSRAGDGARPSPADPPHPPQSPIERGFL